MIRTIVFLGLFTFPLQAVFASAQSIPSASELIDKYTQALDSTKNFIDHYEESNKFGYRFPPASPTSHVRFAGIAFGGTGLRRGQHRYDDQRIYLQTYIWGDFNERLGNLPEDSPNYSCNVADRKNKKYYQHNKRINDPSSRLGSAAAFSSQERQIDVVLSRNGGVSYIVGYIGSDTRLDTVLRNARRISVRPKTENVGGSECFVIDADTKCGKYTVWLDPEHGYHPAKVMHSAKKGDHVHSHILAKGDTGTSYMDNVRFEKVDGVWVPMEADAGVYRIVGGNPDYFLKEDIHFRRTQITLNPDHDKLGSFANPILDDPSNDPELVNGTRVILNNPNKKYIWRDGKLIPLSKTPGK